MEWEERRKEEGRREGKKWSGREGGRREGKKWSGREERRKEGEKVRSGVGGG